MRFRGCNRDLDATGLAFGVGVNRWTGEEPCMAAQALVTFTTAPPSTSSGRWKGKWTFSVKDLLDKVLRDNSFLTPVRIKLEGFGVYTCPPWFIYQGARWEGM